VIPGLAAGVPEYLAVAPRVGPELAPPPRFLPHPRFRTLSGAMPHPPQPPEGHGGAGLPPDAELFGRTVVHATGVRLGRIEAVVRQTDWERLALVRRSRPRRRWYCVALAGGRLVDGRVIVTAGYRREPLRRTSWRPSPFDQWSR
jgi:hypothetical protein